MPNPGNVYVCPRCLYETSQKWMIKRHFHSKKPCAKKTNVILTSDVINEVLVNRIYLGRICDCDVFTSHITQTSHYVTNNQKNRLDSSKKKSRARENKGDVRFHEPCENKNGANTRECVPTNSNTSNVTCISDIIPDLIPLETTTECGKNVWVMYANSEITCTRIPIRVVIENGVQRMHLFDFINALTGSNDNVQNEWAIIEKSLEDHAIKKTMMSKFRFPELDCPILTYADSMTIDTVLATKMSLAFSNQTGWLNKSLISIGVIIIDENGDLVLTDKTKYNYISQQLLKMTEPDDFLRLWGKHSTTTQQQDTYSLTPIATTTVDDIVIDTVEKCNRKRHRSRSRSRSRPRDGVGILYVYQIIPRYQTREEVYRHLSNVIKCDLPLSAIISKNDLNGLFLIKSGRTKYTIGGRIEKYMSPLCSELYQVILVNACEYVVKYGDLEDAERKSLTKIRELNPESEEMAGMLLESGELIWPNEVFRVKNVETVHCQIKEAIAEYYAGLLVEYVNMIQSVDNEQTKLKRIEIEKELKQIELESKQIEINGKLELLKILRDQGASIEQITQAYYGT